MRQLTLDALALRNRIRLLVWLRRLAGLAAVLALAEWLWQRHAVWGTVVAVLACLGAAAALQAWTLSLRRQFVREARLPVFLVTKLREAHPHISARDADLVLHGLRQFFLAYLRGGRKFVAMPSKAVDDAWHEFILHTRGYESWCHHAFGQLLHHTPAEVLGRDPKRNDGLRRAWYWACKEESINPRNPARLPLLFALDKKLGIAGGFSYVPDCRDIDRQSGSDVYCGTSFSEDGGFASDGSADSFGGSENSHGVSESGSDSSSSSDGCGGGCGGD